MQQLEILFSLDDYHVHSDARVSADEELTVTTPAARWAYALSFPPRAGAERNGMWLVTVDVAVESGQIGIGVLRDDGRSFIKEAVVSSSTTVVLRVPDGEKCGALVVRNAGGDGAGRARLRSVTCRREPGGAQPYLVDIPARHVAGEVRPVSGGIEVFDDANAAGINTARIGWLSRLDLDPKGRAVLDVGAGVGYFSRYYADRGASVVALEGRAENVAVLRERHPDIQAHVADVQAEDLRGFATFDIVHCFGLLYHLDSPVIALRRMEAVCRDVLLLETMVCDSRSPIMLLADETHTVNQALAGLGCRPSPTFVAMALNRIGFANVYGTTDPPHHPDFQFDWLDNGDVTRHGHNLRCMFVASRRPLADRMVTPLL
jgi:SAM-dependent methyltransferase